MSAGLTRIIRQATRLAALALGLAAGGCRQAPSEALTWSESYLLLGITDQGRVVEAEARRTNAGLLRGQGRLGVTVWVAGETPLAMARTVLPEQVRAEPGDRGLRLGEDGLWRDAAAPAWTARFASPEANARLRLEPEGVPAPAPAAWLTRLGQWTVALPVPLGDLAGWVEAEHRGGGVNGRAVLLHRGGDGVPPGGRRIAVVLGPDTSIGIVVDGDGQLAWGVLEGRRLDTRDAALSSPEGRRWTLDLRPAEDVVIRLRAKAPAGAADLRGGLFRVERLVLDRLRLPAIRRVRPALARIAVGDRTLALPAAIRRED